MKSLLLTLILVLTGAGHQLTDLWKQYDAAAKADLPKKEASILQQIKTQAQQQRLHADFWDAATLYVTTVQRRDWKQRESLRAGLEKEVLEYDEPIITFLWMDEWKGSTPDELWAYLQAHPLEGNNPALHRGVDSFLGGALVQFMESDMEWAHWRLLQGRYSENVAASLEKMVEGKYPQQGALEYYQLGRKYYTKEERDLKRAALKALQDRYGGKALALYPEGDILEMDFQDLGEKKSARSVDYSDLFEKCRLFERRRAALMIEEKEIAGSYTKVHNLSNTLTSKDLRVKADMGTLSVLFRNVATAKVTLYKDDTVVETWDAYNSEGSFYVFDTLRLELPHLADGRYKAVAESGKLSSTEYYNQYTLSIAARADAEGRKVYVADYKTGKPLSKVDLILMKGDTQVAKSTLKLDGFTRIPESFDKILDEHPKTYYSFVAASEDRRSRTVSAVKEASRYVADNSLRCNVYRDRGAYNPLDTLKFKVVVYQGDPMLQMSVCKGRSLEVVFQDAEGNVLRTIGLKTGEYGSASGSFAIPGGLRNGMFSMHVKDVATKEIIEWDSFRVDEFVLPTFSLNFDKRTQLYMVGDAVPVSGRVESYSGHGLSGAKVKIKVDIWSGRKVYETESPLDTDGIFRFEVPAVEEGYYRAEVTVVDSTGETLSFKDGFYAGKNLGVETRIAGAEDAELTLPEQGMYLKRVSRFVVRSSRISAVFQAKDANGNPVPLNVSYVLSLDGREVASGEAPSGEEMQMNAPQSGLYVLSASVKAKLASGEEVTESTQTKVLVLLPGEASFKVPGSRVFIAGPSTVDSAISAFLGTSQGDAWVIATVYGKDSQVLETRQILVRDGRLQAINYQYKESWPDAVRLQLFYFIDGKAVKYERQYRRERTKVVLPLKFTRFQDKAFPAAEYTFTLRTESGVEALAAAWDKSMDAIVRNCWAIVDQRDYTVPQVYIQSACGTVGGEEEIVLYSLGATAFARNKSVMEAAVMDDAAVTEEASIPEDMAVRSEFLPALTFQPHLVSAPDGTLSFSFRTSDKLSTYYVRVYAHDKSMRNAMAEGEMVVSIPVKVAFQEPRFLYQGDVWEAAITVSSMAETTVSGIIALKWESGSAQIPVDVPAGKTVTRVIPVTCTSDFAVQTFTAAFIAEDFSDAVRVKVPVYPASQSLTEAHSAVLRDGEDKDALIGELRSRFVNVAGSDAAVKEISVLDMVRDAIPSRVDPSADDVLSLSEAWYVRLMASRLEMAEPDGAGLEEKILSCRNADGGFGWFEGMNSSPIITAAILERMAALRDRGFTVPDVTSSVKYLDASQFGEKRPVWLGSLSQAQYMHVRALYASVPFTQKADAEFRKEAKAYLTPSAKDGRGLQGQILAKARRLLTLRNLLERSGGTALAKAWGVTVSKCRIKSSLKADVASLLEYAVEHRDGGWYYPNAVMPWRGLLESEAYAHALLCNLLNPYSPEVADGIRLWLMLQKETQRWDAEPAFIDAITAILDGSEAVLNTEVLSLSASFTAPFDEIKAAGNGFTLERRFYIGDREIQPGESVKVGDKIKIVYRIWNGENRSFVKLTAGREASLNPVQQLSGPIGWRFRSFSPQGYRNVKAEATEYYFDSYPEENTEITEEFYVTRAGVFQAPSAVIESLYAPHYRANSQYRTPLASTL